MNKKKAVIHCLLCKEIFDKNNELEDHMESHDQTASHDCKECGKSFYLEWRLKKHMVIHQNKKRRNCHYFNNKKICPFERNGCMFTHEKSTECQFGKHCNEYLCPMKHSNVEECCDQIPPTVIDEKMDMEGSIVDVTDCAHSRLKQISSCFKSVQKADADIKCDDCDKIVCKPCFKIAQSYQKKKIVDDTGKFCILCLQKKQKKHPKQF